MTETTDRLEGNKFILSPLDSLDRGISHNYLASIKFYNRGGKEEHQEGESEGARKTILPRRGISKSIGLSNYI